jgi:hypothetical protein
MFCAKMDAEVWREDLLVEGQRYRALHVALRPPSTRQEGHKPLWEGIVSQDVLSKRCDVVRELEESLSRLLKSLDVFLIEVCLRHGDLMID